MKLKLLLVSTLLGVMLPEVSAKDLTLAENGKTNYVIVTKAATPADKRAAQELQSFLKQASNASFAIVQKEVKGKKSIILDPASIKDSYSISFKGENIILKGEGEAGRANAVYEFLRVLGFRFFSPFKDTLIPNGKKLLKISDSARKGTYSFRIRGSQTFFYGRLHNPINSALYHYRNGQNILLREYPGLKNRVTEYKPSVHTLACYLNPGKSAPRRGNFHRQLDWIPNKDYFKTNPEWFPMDQKGKRVPLGQLCFSNKEMRKELTKNVLGQLEREIARTKCTNGVISLSMNDIVYAKFCFCPECDKLAKKYNHKGAGAFYEYLVEFCNEVKKRYKNVKVSTFAYMPSLSMPENLKMPDNLIVIFCPIYSSYICSLEMEKNQKTLNYLKKWANSSVKLWYWYYTMPYSGAEYLTNPPMSNITRISSDIRTMKKLGIDGTYFEHDSKGNDRTAFFALQSYLLLQLYRDADADVKTIIKEFTDYYYGKAAPLFRKYLYEVEKGCVETAKLRPRSVYNTYSFSYLNVENLTRWSKMFDEMERLTAKDAKHLYHVKKARLSVESCLVSITASPKNRAATLQKVAELEKEVASMRKTCKYTMAMSRFAKWRKALEKKMK